MVTPVWAIQRELKYAQAREAYYENYTPPPNTTVVPNPRQIVAYNPLFLKVGTAVPKLLLQASQKAVAWFGVANLGVSVADADVSAAIPTPRGFKPSMAKAMVGDATPTAKIAFNGTGRRYIKYSGSTDGAAQAHYNAPVCDPGATPDLAGLQTKMDAIITAKKATVGVYGRLSFSLEKLSKSGA